MSHYQSLGLSILVQSPIWYDTVVTYEPLSHRFGNLSFSKAADGGYLDATITFTSDKLDAESWYQNGLGRDVQIYNPEAQRTWKGFVNKINISMGTLTAVRGPLLDVDNKVAVAYSTVDTSVSPPVVGMRDTTAFESDTDSQDQYAIQEYILSVGGSSETNAEQLRDVHLNDNKDPPRSENIRIGASSNEISVRLELCGYVRFLEQYSYSSTTTGTTTASGKIESVLGADPNSIFSTNYAYIDTNSTAVGTYENDDRIAWQIIRGIVSKGDSSNNRWTFSILDDEIAHYSTIDTEISYRHAILDPKQQVVHLDRGIVNPWDIEPGRWLFVSDFLVGNTIVRTVDIEDPRLIFIERVQYSTPYNVNILGGKIEKSGQLLSRLGLGGTV